MAEKNRCEFEFPDACNQHGNFLNLKNPVDRVKFEDKTKDIEPICMVTGDLSGLVHFFDSEGNIVVISLNMVPFLYNQVNSLGKAVQSLQKDVTNLKKAPNQ